jgi:virulence-associated protein VagC
MPVRVQLPDGTVKIVKIKKPLIVLPLCKDCGENVVTAQGMKYCEACK